MATQTNESTYRPANDAYTGMLTISLIALITGSVLLFLDYSQYPERDAPKVPKTAPAQEKAAPPTPKVEEKAPEAKPPEEKMDEKKDDAKKVDEAK